MIRLFIVVFLLAAISVHGHLGNPNVLAEGQAGPFAVRVIIKPPEVIPGIAEITVRLHSEQARKIQVLPIFWKTGKKGSPAPDEALLIPGETNLYAATLWFMSAGTYLVEIAVEGTKGAGSLSVPVNAMATNTRPMTKPYTLMLGFLAVLLFVSAGKIALAIFRDSLLVPGTVPAPRDSWRGAVMTAVILLVFISAAWGGKNWWNSEEMEYRNNRLYVPLPVTAEIFGTNNSHALRLTVDDSNRRGKWTPLIPDHGKMMHLFLVRDPDPKVFAHLHPRVAGGRKFEAMLPPLPPGAYKIYGDVTHENGFAETLTASVKLPEPLPGSYSMLAVNASEAFCSAPLPAIVSSNSSLFPDVDDSWHIDRQTTLKDAAPKPGELQRSVPVGGGWSMIWENFSRLVVNQESTLQFSLRTATNTAAPIQNYMGMAGHLVLRSGDGAVFSHLHPDGNYSMAAQHFFAVKNKANELNSAQETMTPADLNEPLPPISGVRFPCAFPRPGNYRIWVQMKSQGRIFTGVFDVKVADR